MKKYSALSQHLSQADADYIELSFAQIEQIISAPLPASATRYPAWWANEKAGKHSWAHLWRAAGWQKERVDFTQQIVVFRRTNQSTNEVRDELLPRTKETIFDLLQIVGISTDEWFQKADGQHVKSVKANPSFCYDWSFGSRREGYALCIWHDTLEIDKDNIIFDENLRDHGKRLYEDAQSAGTATARKSRSLAQAARARAFDNALNVSYLRGLPVSVIVTEGDRRSREEMGEGSSHVQFRSLDPIKWYVHKYNEQTGEHLLIRGIKPPELVDDSEDPIPEDLTRPDEIQQRAIKIRRGQAKFREGLLAAYHRTCAITGCKVVDLLEAAHIRPHAEEPNYNMTNGLLLRADIHTLFDIGLLAVDSRFRIWIAPALLLSEYKIYDGKYLRQPELPSNMPNTDALERRYKEFTEKHSLLEKRILRAVIVARQKGNVGQCAVPNTKPSH